LALVPIDGALLAALVTGPGSVDVWRRAHAWLTLLALLPLAGHVFLALVFPPTRPSLRGMLSGAVDREWAVHHHPHWGGAPSPGRKDEAA
jgi:cytochrome b subunit of formate dehydrogenase